MRKRFVCAVRWREWDAINLAVKSPHFENTCLVACDAKPISFRGRTLASGKLVLVGTKGADCCQFSATAQAMRVGARCADIRSR
jgi:hypothetical protein